MYDPDPGGNPGTIAGRRTNSQRAVAGRSPGVEDLLRVPMSFQGVGGRCPLDQMQKIAHGGTAESTGITLFVQMLD